MQKILIIYTGGTIGMSMDSDTNSLAPFDFGKIYDRIPELKNFNCTIDFYSFHPLIDSSDMQPDKWIQIANHINEQYDAYNGFVILHGTDTMSYTASALSFMLENLSKPVILTGSQLPLEAARTDARSNIITAVDIACAQNNNAPLINEVCILFDDFLFRGNRTEKYTSSKFDAYKSENYPPLAEAGVEIVYNTDALLPLATEPFKVDLKITNQITLIKLFPGIMQSFIDNTLALPGLKGVILETYGSGNAPTNDAFLDALKLATDKGIVIVNVSQCSGGTVDAGKYESSYHLQNTGVISGGDMTTEAALTKLMFLLGKNLSKIETEDLMQKNLRGELSE